MPRLALGLAMLLALASSAAAQDGRVYGSLTDESGAVLPGVEVRALLRDASGETTRRVVTNGAGQYQLNGLTDGNWVITASLPGFETATYRQAVHTGDSLDWSPTLELGSIQETITVTTAPPEPTERREAPRPLAAAPPPPPPAPAGPVRVGGNVKPPRKIASVSPLYPADAVSQGIGGVVILRATIATDGSVRDVTTLRSPNESLTQAASNAIVGWEFTPTLLNGSPVATRMTATFNFSQK
jgi:TonB family protein